MAHLVTLDDPAELRQAQVKEVLKVIFRKITDADADITARKEFLKDMATKILTGQSPVITTKLENFVIDEVTKLMDKVTPQEHPLCLRVLGATEMGRHLMGQCDIIDLAITHAKIHPPPETLVINDAFVECVIQTVSAVLPYFSDLISTDRVVAFICDKLLPLHTWSKIGATSTRDNLQLRLLKLLAELSANADGLENAAGHIGSVYNLLVDYMPRPQLDAEDADNSLKLTSFEFLHIECLIYTFYTLGKKQSEAVSLFADAEKLNGFRGRLEYLARGAQLAREHLTDADDDLLKATTNISTILRDLLNVPSLCQQSTKLSWLMPKPTQCIKNVQRAGPETKKLFY